MLFLIASILALLCGPMLYALAVRRPGLWCVLDGAVIVSVFGLVLLFVLPQLWQSGGHWTGLAFGLGVLFPLLLEHRSENVQSVFVVLASLGLLGHTLLDGLTLGTDSGGGWRPLSVSVVLHQLPVSMAVWSVLLPQGVRVAWLGLGLIGVGTVAGYYLGGDAAQWLSAAPLSLLQAFLAGALLHIVVHRQNAGHHHLVAEAWGAVGVGVLMLVTLVFLDGHDHGHDHDHGPGWSAFVVWYRWISVIVLGTVLGAVAIRRKVSRDFIERVLRRLSGWSVLAASLLSAAVPHVHGEPWTWGPLVLVVAGILLALFRFGPRGLIMGMFSPA